MAWTKSGETTLGATSDNLDITSMTATKFNMVMFHKIASGQSRLFQTFNDNNNNVYAVREATNNGTNATSYVNQPKSDNISTGGTHDDFAIQFICSIANEEKLVITLSVNRNGTGSAVLPELYHMVMKFVPSPDADITRIDLNNTGTGDYASDSNISVLGSD